MVVEVIAPAPFVASTPSVGVVGARHHRSLGPGREPFGPEPDGRLRRRVRTARKKPRRPPDAKRASAGRCWTGCASGRWTGPFRLAHSWRSATSIRGRLLQLWDHTDLTVVLHSPTLGPATPTVSTVSTGSNSVPRQLESDVRSPPS